jgi:hypothetical protein
MKKRWSFAFAVIFMCMVGSNAFAGEKVKFVMDVSPGAFMISPDADGFSVTNTSGWITWTESVDGTGSWAPNATLGVGYDAGDMMTIDLTGGGGFWVNEAFDATTFLIGKISAAFRLGKYFTLGAQAGVIHFNEPEWQGIAQVKFSDSDGFLAGGAFTAGTDKISFYLSVEYMDIDPLDVTTSGGWQANSNELDLSGTMVNLGVKFRF